MARALVVVGRVALGLALVPSALVPAWAGPLDRPPPEVYAKAEDQERARLIAVPCAPADEGQGCERENGVLTRKWPCTYRIDSGTIGFRRTDECYRMDARRRFRGVWVDEFEGQRFIPEGTTPPEWPDIDSRTPDLREKFEAARLATIWLDISRAKPAWPSRRGTRRYFIEFLGRQTMFPGAYGHLGMSGHEIIVDKVIALRECPKKGPCG